MTILEKRKKIKHYNNRIESLTIAIQDLTKMKQELEEALKEEKEETILFYIYSEKDFNLIEPTNKYNNYFYDILSGEITITTSEMKPEYNHSNVINTQALITDEKDFTIENLETIKNNINKYIEYITRKYKIIHIDELFRMTKLGLTNGEYELITKENTLSKKNE